MVSKDHPFYKLEKKRNSFLAIGLAISLFIALTAMEWTTVTLVTKDLPPEEAIHNKVEIDVVITIQKKKKKKAEIKRAKPQVILNPVKDIIKEWDTVPEIIRDTIFEIPEPPIKDTGKVPPFLVVEKMPQFGTGMKDLMNYLSSKIQYPDHAQTIGKEGIVYISFVINRKGEVVDPKVLKGVGYGLDKEALRVVSNMPNWEPGKQRGKKVPVQFTLPVKFKLKQN